MRALLLLALSADPDLDAWLARIRAVGAEGEGHAEAGEAVRKVVARGPDALLPTLAAFDGAGPRAQNWLRGAVDALAAAGKADAKALEAFLLDRRRSGEGRFAAYEILVRLDPAAPGRLLPGMLDEAGRELRREAVAQALKGAEGKPEALRKLLPSARDVDQVGAIVKQLKSAGIETDLHAHYGVVARWTLLASFDNAGMKGFDAAYPPEAGVDLRTRPAGKGGAPVRAVPHETKDPAGKVDLNAVLGKEMSAVAYAFAVVESDEERSVELRVGTNNAVKVFLNGKLGAFRNEYHHGMKMDQYVARGTLRKGRNEILLKLCQNEQKDDWAQSWSFQARLCDALGGAVPFRSAGP